MKNNEENNGEKKDVASEMIPKTEILLHVSYCFRYFSYSKFKNLSIKSSFLLYSYKMNHFLVIPTGLKWVFPKTSD